METTWLDKFKDPQFRLEVYEYLIDQVQQRIQFLNKSPDDCLDTHEPGYTGFMCINLKVKYEHEPGFVQPCGRKLGEPNEIDILLPELKRPPDLDINSSAWWGDNLSDNHLRMACLIDALEHLKQKINQK